MYARVCCCRENIIYYNNEPTFDDNIKIVQVIVKNEAVIN